MIALMPGGGRGSFRPRGGRRQPARLPRRHRARRDGRGYRGHNAVFQHSGRALSGGLRAGRGPAPAAQGPQFLKFPGKNEGLVVLGDRPLVAETPESLLDDDTTPIEKFYIRNNGQIPEEAKDADAWKIVIDGQVENKLEITLGELKRSTRRSPIAWCWNAAATAARVLAAGARQSVEQWRRGLRRMDRRRTRRRAEGRRAEPSAKYTAHYAPTCISPAIRAHRPISRGVRIEKTMEANTLIVWGMNEKPLPNIHGGPVRLVVPGWAGSASQKWLTRITHPRQGARRAGDDGILLPRRRSSR